MSTALPGKFSRQGEKKPQRLDKTGIERWSVYLDIGNEGDELGDKWGQMMEGLRGVVKSLLFALRNMGNHWRV